MSDTPFQVALWIELLAAGLGGLQGALFAAGLKDRRIDVLGVIMIGLAVSLGGSLLRDIVLDQPPVVVWMNWYLLVAGASAVLGMVLQPLFTRANWLIIVLDAVDLLPPGRHPVRRRRRDRGGDVCPARRVRHADPDRGSRLRGRHHVRTAGCHRL